MANAVKDVTEKVTDAELLKMSEDIGTILKKSPKVKVRVPIDQLNKADKSPIYVAINGYQYLINRGETVDVPEQVATLLQEGGYI